MSNTVTCPSNNCEMRKCVERSESSKDEGAFLQEILNK